jgi:hypothetical protein
MYSHPYRWASILFKYRSERLLASSSETIDRAVLVTNLEPR